MTRFLCQELVYEYATDQLDPWRASRVAEFLPTCRESQRELDRIQRALAYTQLAGEVELRPEFAAGILDEEPQWKRTLSGWSFRSSQTGWRLLPYLALGTAIVLTLIVAKPWRPPVRTEMVLAEQVKAEPDLLSAPADVKIGSLFASKMMGTPLPSPLEGEASPSLLAASEDETDDPPQDAAFAKPSANSNPASAVPVMVAREVVTEEHDTGSPTGPKGWLRREELEVSDFANSWPAIQQKITELGGVAAGNVELGWRRNLSESYFHFALPESKENELMVFLKTFGPVRISKERHPRVMPDGQIRIILTVKDANAHEGPSEAP